MIQTVYLQGGDFKAKNWSFFLRGKVKFFVSLKDQYQMFLRCRAGDLVIYRYQNNDSRLLVCMLEYLLLISSLVKSRLCDIKIVWICHNVDQDTSPFYKVIEKSRRKLLFKMASLVLVLDPALKKYVNATIVDTITFGKKNDGRVTEIVLQQIRDFSSSRDVVILIASQDGLKYRSFERVPILHKQLGKKYGRVGFVLAGISRERMYDATIEKDVMRIFEQNLDESAIANYVNFIYRENDDLSIPYTLYAAATAKIPLLTKKGSILSEVVARENIGLDVEDLCATVSLPESFDFESFWESHSWETLAKILTERGFVR